MNLILLLLLSLGLKLLILDFFGLDSHLRLSGFLFRFRLFMRLGSFNLRWLGGFCPGFVLWQGGFCRLRGDLCRFMLAGLRGLICLRCLGLRGLDGRFRRRFRLLRLVCGFRLQRLCRGCFLGLFGSGFLRLLGVSDQGFSGRKVVVYDD